MIKNKFKLFRPEMILLWNGIYFSMEKRNDQGNDPIKNMGNLIIRREVKNLNGEPGENLGDNNPQLAIFNISMLNDEEINQRFNQEIIENISEQPNLLIIQKTHPKENNVNYSQELSLKLSVSSFNGQISYRNESFNKDREIIGTVKTQYKNSKEIPSEVLSDEVKPKEKIIIMMCKTSKLLKQNQ